MLLIDERACLRMRGTARTSRDFRVRSQNSNSGLPQPHVARFGHFDHKFHFPTSFPNITNILNEGASSSYEINSHHKDDKVQGFCGRMDLIHIR